MTEALKIWKAKGRDVDMELLDYSLVALQGLQIFILNPIS